MFYFRKEIFEITRDFLKENISTRTKFKEQSLNSRLGWYVILGSIPIVALFEKELKSKTILMGFGLDSDAIHSPNEHFGVFNYLKGIETIPLFYKYFTEMYS